MTTPACTGPPAGPPSLRTGAHLLGRYEVLEQVGRGGSGSVWRAHDLLLRRDVAIKSLRTSLDRDPAGARERAHHEGRAAARVHHPCLAAIFDMAELDGDVVLVMEYLRGSSLEQVLQNVGRLTPHHAARIGARIAEGLAAAHAHGVVHRDVKPANVVLGASEGGETAAIADFGIAGLDTDPTADGHTPLAGTPHFMAPEAARGAPATAAGDVWSLGATLYTAVEGRPPVGDCGNALEVLSRVAGGQVAPPRRAGPLAPLLAAMLAHDAAARPGAEQTRVALETIAASAPGASPTALVPAPVAPPAFPTARPISRRSMSRRSRVGPPAAVLVGTAGLVAAGAVAAVLGSSTDFAPGPAPGARVGALPPVPMLPPPPSSVVPSPAAAAAMVTPPSPAAVPTSAATIIEFDDDRPARPRTGGDDDRGYRGEEGGKHRGKDDSDDGGQDKKKGHDKKDGKDKKDKGDDGSGKGKKGKN